MLSLDRCDLSWLTAPESPLPVVLPFYRHSLPADIGGTTTLLQGSYEYCHYMQVCGGACV